MGNPLKIQILAMEGMFAAPVIETFDVLSALPALCEIDSSLPSTAAHEIAIVSEAGGMIQAANALPLTCHKSVEEGQQADIVIIPSVGALGMDKWEIDQSPKVLDWLRRMHEGGAHIYAACLGVFLLVEAGLLRDTPATTHWTNASLFWRTFQDAQLKMEKTVIVTSNKGTITMCGGPCSWQDLVLMMISRHIGATAAHTLANHFSMHWHGGKEKPLITFTPDFSHEDPVVEAAQQWLKKNFSAPSPVEKMVALSGISERSFNRRFSTATGMSPLKYVQQLRIEKARRCLESSAGSIEDICWRVGYEDTAFFCRLFKRITGNTPGAYRKKFAASNMAFVSDTLSDGTPKMGVG